MNKIKEFFSNFKISNLSKKNIRGIIIIILIILIIFIIITSVINGNKKRECQNLRNDILTITDDYMSKNELLPILNGTSKTINLSDLNNNIVFKDYDVNGTVTYTKYNDEYIKTVNINNAEFCSTKDFKNESDEYDNSKNVKVEVSFNYVTVEKGDTPWSNWYPSEDISTEETDGVLLPIDIKKLPTVPKNAIITEYVRETEIRYSYRDKRWRWYKNNISYSDFSSEKPNGYSTKDTSVKLSTEPTSWSIDYPEEKDYRHITKKTGYRWYYTNDNDEKIYWNNGEYSPECPSDEYKRDSETTVTMYSYTDDLWRWYNGSTKRIYSNYSSSKPNGYTYKDNETLTYTNWSGFTNTSSINNENKSYREERTDTYSRYSVNFEIHSLPILENYVTLEELESKLDKSYEEISKDETLQVLVNFKFYYE